MKWLYQNNIKDEDIKEVENILGIKFPLDFIQQIKHLSGAYPKPNRITIDGYKEVVNNLVSFKKDDISYILTIMNDTEYFNKEKLIPIAEDPFGNLFCYSIEQKMCEIVFWNHENSKTKHVCGNFGELISLLHD